MFDAEVLCCGSKHPLALVLDDRVSHLGDLGSVAAGCKARKA